MINTIQNYAWGSREYLQKLTGIEEKGPLAELWMGVHPRGESRVCLSDGTIVPLSDLIRQDPERYLGKSLQMQFGNLPFLFKLLAAGEPLSIQAHPSKSQAEEGFARENSRGIPLGAFHRNYKDDNHKPEIICALTPYWAMKGFRTPGEIKTDFLPWLPEYMAPALIPEEDLSSEEFLRFFFQGLMTLESPERESVLEAALLWASREKSDAARWVMKLHEKYPGDIGILAPLYLNTLCLKPGDALYLPAGELHAYLEGFGVELMANSDNVLRGGLTPKHINVSELLKTLTFAPGKPEILKPRLLPDGTSLYDTPSKEFQLLQINLKKEITALHLETGYPVAILVVTEGCMRVKEEGAELELREGESGFISSGTRGINISALTGEARGFIARAVPE